MKATLTFFAAALAAASAFAHAKLQDSTPANGATVEAAPAALKLHYNEPVEAAMSTVKLTGPGAAAVATDKVAADQADARTLVLAIPRLRPGDYKAEWSTMGHDGHRTRGEIRFTVK